MFAGYQKKLMFNVAQKKAKYQKPDDNQLQTSLLSIFRIIYWCRPGPGIAYRSQP